eukprot:scaffold3096_cov403-Prasinococcus_capsulatus_cf.AAC.2
MSHARLAGWSPRHRTCGSTAPGHVVYVHRYRSSWEPQVTPARAGVRGSTPCATIITMVAHDHDDHHRAERGGHMPTGSRYSLTRTARG